MNTQVETNEVETPQGIFISERGEVEEHIAEYQFDVREEILVTESGIEVPNRRALIRTDTNAVLGTVGSNYKVLTHAAALDPILDNLKRKKIKTFQRVALTAGGAKMYANIYFPGQEITMGTRESKRDNCWPGIGIVNSIDGTLKYHLEATIFRLACTNGMRVPTAISSFTTSHSKNKSFDDLVDEIIGRVSDTNKFTTLQKWADHVMDVERMNNMAEKIIKNKKCLFPARYLDLVKKEIKKEESFDVVSVWGLYNAFNSVLEHNLIREKGKMDRARMLDENLFKVFETTFK